MEFFSEEEEEVEIRPSSKFQFHMSTVMWLTLILAIVFWAGSQFGQRPDEGKSFQLFTHSSSVVLLAAAPAVLFALVKIIHAIMHWVDNNHQS
ncbi:MAG: hypothetical protein MPJ24_03425 [Pirellulaceae bacterium]|nr:hypothetical protein [Pirellulaceae bacterium]